MRLWAILLAASLSACVTMQSGLDAMQRGDLDAAEANFQQALGRGDTMAWNNLGVVYERRGNRAKAITYYTMAARWGHQVAQQNLANLGAPIPSADLAQQRARTNAADTANTLMLMNAINPPRRPIPAPIHCNSYRVGNSVQTDCQ